MGHVALHTCQRSTVKSVLNGISPLLHFFKATRVAQFLFWTAFFSLLLLLSSLLFLFHKCNVLGSCTLAFMEEVQCHGTTKSKATLSVASHPCHVKSCGTNETVIRVRVAGMGYSNRHSELLKFQTRPNSTALLPKLVSLFLNTSCWPNVVAKMDHEHEGVFINQMYRNNVQSRSLAIISSCQVTRS